MVTPDEIDEWAPSEEQQQAFDKVKRRYKGGAQKYRLLMPGEELPFVEYAMHLERLLNVMNAACADLWEEVEEKRKSAMTVYDRHGRPTE